MSHGHPPHAHDASVNDRRGPLAPRAAAERTACRALEAARLAAVRHAGRAWPNEAVGLLWARADGLITSYTPLPNTHPAPHRAAFVPKQAIAVGRGAFAARGLHLAGIAHSHPDGKAVPSRSDRAHFDTVQWLWVLATQRDRTDKLAAFRRCHKGRVLFADIVRIGEPDG